MSFFHQPPEPVVGGRIRSFWVRGDVLNVVGVAFDREIKPAILAGTSLPDVLGFVVLFGTQRWVVEVLGQQAGLLQNGPLNTRGASLNDFRERSEKETFIWFV